MLKFLKILTQDEPTNRTFNSIETIISQLNKIKILFGNHIKDISFEQNQPNKIAHGLKQNYTGFIIIKKDNYGDIKLSKEVNNNKVEYIVLDASQTMVADLWIF